MNRRVFSEDEKSRGRMMENETILLMETRSRRAMPSKVLDISKQFFKVGRINRIKTNLYTQQTHICSQYNLALISPILDKNTFKQPV